MGVTTVRRHMASATLTMLTIIAGCGDPAIQSSTPGNLVAIPASVGSDHSFAVARHLAPAAPDAIVEDVPAPTPDQVAGASAEQPAVRVPTDEVLAGSSVAPLAGLGEPRCLTGEAGEMLTGMTSGAGLFHGADYQRAFNLPDGRTLWMFQDALVATPSGLDLVHNAGLLQSGNCFQILVAGTDEAPQPYLFADATSPMEHWFWPLAGGMGIDGRFRLFVAEMREHGDRYLSHTEPVGTWIVTIDPETMAVVDQRPAPNASNALFGWSVASDDTHSYLYSHCYRQFGFEPLPFTDPPALVHDWGCSADVGVARVPAGRFDLAPEYWDGNTWQPNAAAAVPVIPTEGRAVNPTQVARQGEEWVAVTKVDDWWGNTIVVDRAPAPEGPWTTVRTVEVGSRCGGCTTYFASIVPGTSTGSDVVVGLSNNTWDGTDAALYGVSFLTVPIV